MNAIEIGNTYTTAVSGVTGTVQEIVKNASGSARVRLQLASTARLLVYCIQKLPI